MWREGSCAEDAFLAWLLALPEREDPARAAAAWIAELDAEASPTRVRLCELLRQVTPFAAPARKRRLRGAAS
jgi:hypothetical protein